MAVIVLLAPLQALNPRLVEAAQALGAPRWKAHVTITIPLSARGLLAAFMLCFTFSISAFVIPMVLGKGRVLFVSNLIYSRFGEVGNYPGGAALSIALLDPVADRRLCDRSRDRQPAGACPIDHRARNQR